MKNTTKQDILDNLPFLTGSAHGLLAGEMQGDDWWATIEIGDLWFDLNVFLWQENGNDVVKVSAYPMYEDGNGYWQTDYSTFVPLVTKNVGTGIVQEGA